MIAGITVSATPAESLSAVRQSTRLRHKVNEPIASEAARLKLMSQRCSTYELNSELALPGEQLIEEDDAYAAYETAPKQLVRRVNAPVEMTRQASASPVDEKPDVNVLNAIAQTTINKAVTSVALSDRKPPVSIPVHLPARVEEIRIRTIGIQAGLTRQKSKQFFHNSDWFIEDKIGVYSTVVSIIGKPFDGRLEDGR